MNQYILAIFGLPGGAEWIAIGLVALLLFGRRLPDVARSVGKSIVEFKKGLRDVKSDIDHQSKIESDSTPSIENKSESNSDSSSSTDSSNNA